MTGRGREVRVRIGEAEEGPPVEPGFPTRPAAGPAAIRLDSSQLAMPVLGNSTLSANVIALEPLPTTTKYSVLNTKAPCAYIRGTFSSLLSGAESVWW